MFKKTSHDSSIDRSALVEPTLEEKRQTQEAPEFQTRSVSYVGPSLEFNGDIIVDETFVIEGIIRGTVTSKDRKLTVGKQGRVYGELHGQELEVRGHVEGDIFGYERVRLCNTAVVSGTVHCKRLLMDDGADLNGTVDMKIDRKELAKKVIKSVQNKNKNKSESVANIGS